MRSRALSVALVALLVSSVVLLVGSRFASAQIEAGPKTISVDGNPSDWTGINILPNTGAYSSGEFFWNDTTADDTGDGDYAYPTASPDFIPGLFDIQELRITADANNLYVLVKVVDLSNPWGGSDGFSTVAAVLLIDTTTDGAGQLVARPNVNITAGKGWEYFAKIGNTGWHAENAKVFDASGKWAPITNKGDSATNAIEVAIPLSFLGKDGHDIDGATWRFMFFLQSHAGENQDGFRDVNETAEPYLFGGGLTGNNNDPKIQDIAFSATQAAQEAELSSYSASSAATISSSADVLFSSSIGFTPDTTAPQIQTPAAVPTFNQADISWTTDELANTTVWYGTSSPPTIRRSVDEFVTSHAVTLSGLDSGTTYYYRIESWDIAGNQATSAIGTFATSLPPPANLASWVGTTFSWEDTRGDDTGDGDYVYPNEPTVKWQGRGDIWYVNITPEGNWIHYTVRISAKAETIWRQRMAAFVMFIDQDHVRGSGATSVKFVQAESDPGHPLNISVAPEFAWEYMVLGTFQNYSEFTPGDNRGELLIRSSTPEFDTYELVYMSTALGISPEPTAANVSASNGGTQLDFWLNRSVIGTSDNWTYVALGALYDDAGAGWPSGGIRQIRPSAQTWEGGGSNGPLNPNIYDLAFYPSTPVQQTDLSEYVPTYTSITQAIQVDLAAQWYALLSVESVLGLRSSVSVNQVNTGESAGLVAFVTDRNNAVAGATVSLAANPASAVDILDPNPTTTNSFGAALFTVRGRAVSTDTPVTLTATATVGTATVTGTSTLTVKAEVITHTYQLFVSAAGVLETGEQATVTALFTDTGVPISGASVTLASNRPALVVVGPATATTNAQGQATFTVAAGYTEVDVAATLTASATNATVQTTATAAVEVQAFVHTYTLSGTASATLVATDDTATVTFTFRDAGAPRAGATVSIALSPTTGFDIVGNAQVTTGANGQATFTLRARAVTADTAVVVTATADNGTATDAASATVTVVAQAAAPAPAPSIPTEVFAIVTGILAIAAVAFAVLWLGARRRRPPVETPAERPPER